MKTISFFSEKGGVGKSTFSIMYASWLHYKYGVKVGLADFNDRITRYRNAEITKREELRKNKPDIPSLNVASAWPIETVKVREIEQLRKDGALKPYVKWFVEKIQGPLAGMDVILCDFPGNLSGKEFVEMAGFQLLNLVVIPTERDPMTIQATRKIQKMLAVANIDHCIFINKAQVGLRNLRSYYTVFGQELMKSKMPLLPDMVSYSERIMAIEKLDNIRSTFGFPDFSLPEYENGKDLGIENLFIDVTRKLAKAPDLKGTIPTDLSFVNRLTKVQDGRQLVGTAFPEYEI